MKTLSSILVALTSVSLAACSKLPGGLKIPGAGTSASPSAAATTVETAAETIGPDRSVKKELVAYYQKQDHHTLHDLLFNSARDAVTRVAMSASLNWMAWNSLIGWPNWRRSAA